MSVSVYWRNANDLKGNLFPLLLNQSYLTVLNGKGRLKAHMPENVSVCAVVNMLFTPFKMKGI